MKLGKLQRGVMIELPSRVWSSETLVQGLHSVSAQPAGLLAKTEEDKDLVDEFQVAWRP